jgi:hypothetical protein
MNSNNLHLPDPLSDHVERAVDHSLHRHPSTHRSSCHRMAGLTLQQRVNLMSISKIICKTLHPGLQTMTTRAHHRIRSVILCLWSPSKQFHHSLLIDRLSSCQQDVLLLRREQLGGILGASMLSLHLIRQINAALHIFINPIMITDSNI